MASDGSRRQPVYWSGCFSLPSNERANNSYDDSTHSSEVVRSNGRAASNAIRRQRGAERLQHDPERRRQVSRYRPRSFSKRRNSGLSRNSCPGASVTIQTQRIARKANQFDPEPFECFDQNHRHATYFPKGTKHRPVCVTIPFWQGLRPELVALTPTLATATHSRHRCAKKRWTTPANCPSSQPRSP